MANILKITRSNVATKGLLLFYVEGATNLKSYKLHKPTELQDLGLVENADGGVNVDITIGQINYSFTDTTLWINGVDQTGQTIDDIHDALSPLFLDGTGGGGGTTDVSTPPHIVYKNAGGELDDSPTQWDNGMFTLLTLIANAGFQVTEATAPDQKIIQMNFNGIDKNVFNLNKINGTASEDFLFSLGKDLQSISMTEDAALNQKIIRIGNANAIVPFGTPIRRAVIDESQGEVFLQSRSSDEENGTKIFADERSFFVEITTSYGTEVFNIIKTSSNIPSAPGFKTVTLTLGDEGTPAAQVRILQDDDNNVLKQIVGDETNTHSAFMVFDQKLQRYTMSDVVIQTYLDQADAVGAGLTSGDLYKVDILSVTGGAAKAICIVS